MRRLPALVLSFITTMSVACGEVASPGDPDAAVRPDAADEPDAPSGTPTCSDGEQNADEIDVDCGGHCGDASCGFGQACDGTASLCETGDCISDVCAAVFEFTGGVETFTVPAGITSITIEALGAGGAPNPQNAGGLGASITGTFTVTPSETLTVAVGGTGVPGKENSGWTGGGGGGGSGVLRGTTALLIAGGGGGAGHQTGGSDAVTGPDGTAGFDNGAGSAGVGGIGGADGTNNTSNSAAGGRGWNGGVPTPGMPMTHAGGWGLGGGGGGSTSNGHAGGGGGGFSGGGAAWDGGGGGGGSINNGTAQVNTAGVQAGDGRVVITAP